MFRTLVISTILLAAVAVAAAGVAQSDMLLEIYTTQSMRYTCDRCGGYHPNNSVPGGTREPLCQKCRALVAAR